MTMLLTEKEYSKKVCHQNFKANCYGSRCAAWRWANSGIDQSTTPDTFFTADEKQGAKMVPTPPTGEGPWQLVGPAGIPGWSHWRRSVPSVLGYCGLAGEPKV